MYVPLILFFISLSGMIVMIGRKVLLKTEPTAVIHEDIFLIQTPNPTELKHVLTKKLREYSYIILVSTIRTSIRTSKLIKSKYQQILNKIIKRHQTEEINKREVSGFLKKISEYKSKIRKIKDQIVEEENQ